MSTTDEQSPAAEPVEDASPNGHAQAPEMLVPAHRWPTQAALIEHFKQSRDRTLDYIRTTQDDLRNHFSQHPVFKTPYSRDLVHVIMRLDPESLDPQNRARRPDGDFPVVWARQYGKGRVFNVGWGHPDATWDDPQFQTMMLEAIKWAMRMTGTDVSVK